MKVGLDKRSFWSKSFVTFCLAGRVRYDPAVTRAQQAGGSSSCRMKSTS